MCYMIIIFFLKNNLDEVYDTEIPQHLPINACNDVL